MDPAQRSSGRWSLLRRSKREALQTMPAGYVTPVSTEAGENKLDYYEPPPPEIPADWDPVSAWLPLAPPATPAAEPSAAHLQRSGRTPSPHSDKPRFGLAAAWGRLKRRASVDIAALPGGTPGSLPSLAGSLSLPAAARQLLGGAARTGLAGRWVRDAGEEGPAAAAAAAAIDALLQLPPLMAAARSRTRELEITESDEELVLAWTTHLAGGACIRPTPLSLDIDGGVTIKVLQGSPLPALISQRLQLSSSGTRLRIVLKVQLLEGGATGPRGTGGGGGRVVGGSAKQATTWHRQAD
ncbi:hypothetical protein ABPG77_005015 [Micractinium sp. CCAP 211/92]